VFWVTIPVSAVLLSVALMRFYPHQRVAPTGPADVYEVQTADVDHAPHDVPAVSPDIAEDGVLPDPEDMAPPGEGEKPLPRMPATQGRVDEQVTLLRGETLAESLANLDDFDFFYWPGSGYDHMEFGIIPLVPDAGSYTIHEVMSNRRVVKMVQELSKLGKNKAASMIAAELTTALEEHKRIFAEFLRKHAEDFGPSAQPHGIGFRLSNNPDGTPTLRGIRWKVLALVFAAGQLRLEGAHAAVLEVCEHALSQRSQLYDETLHNLGASVILLTDASLYNRQILTMGLLGTSEDAEKIEEMLEGAGAAFGKISLASWDAAATPYDARFSDAPVDYSKGRLDVRYLREVSDEAFDAVLTTVRAQ